MQNSSNIAVHKSRRKIGSAAQQWRLIFQLLCWLKLLPQFFTFVPIPRASLKEAIQQLIFFYHQLLQLFLCALSALPLFFVHWLTAARFLIVFVHNLLAFLDILFYFLEGPLPSGLEYFILSFLNHAFQQCICFFKGVILTIICNLLQQVLLFGHQPCGFQTRSLPLAFLALKGLPLCSQIAKHPHLAFALTIVNILTQLLLTAGMDQCHTVGNFVANQNSVALNSKIMLTNPWHQFATYTICSFEFAYFNLQVNFYR